MSEYYKQYGNKDGITVEPPEGAQEIPFNQRLKDYHDLSNDDLLKKYGIKLVYEIWDYVHEIEKINKNPDYFHD